MNRSPRDHLNSRRGWAILAILLSIESFAGIVLVFQTTWQLLQSDQDPLGDRVSLFIAVLLAWVWVLVTLFSGMAAHCLPGLSWSLRLLASQRHYWRNQPPKKLTISPSMTVTMLHQNQLNEMP